MNRERARELVPIIEAFGNGWTIQFDDGDGWSDVDKSGLDVECFDDGGLKYRIKPKPREFWINPDADDSDAIIYESFNPKDDNFIRVQEVIE